MNIVANRTNFRVVQGDILQDRAHVLVCPVNCVPGVMGAGLALQFQRRFPGLKKEQDAACRQGRLKIGVPCVHENYARPHLIGMPECDIILFPSKDRWENKSRYSWIFMGLARLYPALASMQDGRDEVQLAMPALGCGLGGLEWDVVGPMISAWAVGLPERYRVTLYHTHGS